MKFIDLTIPLGVATPPWPTYEPLQLKYFKRLAPNGANGQVVTHSNHLGTSHDTSELACDSFRHWWYTYGQQNYPKATSILVPCDGGGSNSSLQFLLTPAISTTSHRCKTTQLKRDHATP